MRTIAVLKMNTLLIVRNLSPTSLVPGGDPQRGLPPQRGPHGQSPRVSVRVLGRRHRIIPARAGFTRRLRQTGTTSTDHPRSRGVYANLPYRELRKSGSSPLARGLPLIRVKRRRKRGIIPARAGFTCAFWSPRNRICWIIPARAGFTRRRRRRTGTGTDHPRSRGVYIMLKMRSLVVVWIIPARAGFT